MPARAKGAAAGRGKIIPLGAKIAVLVTGLVLIVGGAIAYISVSHGTKLVERQAGQQGENNVKTLARSLPQATDRAQGQTWSTLFEIPPVPDTTREFAFREQELRKAWEKTFESLLNEDIVNIVLTRSVYPVIHAPGKGEFRFAGAGEGEIVDGQYAQGDLNVRARRFRQNISSADGSKNFGHVDVYMSLNVVEKARRELIMPIAAVGGGAALVGVFLSLIIGGTVARPVRTLSNDMLIIRDGNLEHRSSVRTRDEIGVLASSFNEMTQGLWEAQKLREESERMRQDLRLAQEIQEKLLPAHLPGIPRFDISACYEPALEVGGDYYDVIKLPDATYAIVVGDVSGKGIPAGLIMTMTRSLVRMGAQSKVSPMELLRDINTVLHNDLKVGTFVTLMYVVLDPVNGRLTVASGGHNPLLLYTPQEGRCQEVGAPGIALGVAPPPVFNKNSKEISFEIPVGSRVMVYTDGVCEAKDVRDRDLGMGPMYELLEKNPDDSSDDLLAKLLDVVRTHRGEANPSDDITVVTFKRLA